MGRYVLMIILFILTVCLAVSGASAAPFQNGGFEDATEHPSDYSFLDMIAGSDNITHWTVSQGSIDYIGPFFWQPAEGSYSLDLNGSNNGGIQQTFDTIPGVQYKVAFSLAGNPFGGENEKNLRVSVAGHDYDFTFDTTGKTPSNMGWEERSFIFTAISTSTNINFQSIETDNHWYGPALDNVRVTVVPLPSALLFLGSGLLGLGGLRRRR